MTKQILIFFSMLLFSIFSINLYSKDININTDFSKVIVETPCRILYSITNDTTAIINKTPIYNVYWEIKDSTLYIKQKNNNIIDEPNYNECNNIPIIKILINKIPEIQTSNMLMICNKNIKTNNNEKIANQLFE